MSKKAKVNIDLNVGNTSTNTVKTPNQPSIYPLIFGKKNYQMMILGLAVIFLGFGLMMGTNNIIEGPNALYPADEIYSTRRIVIAPIVIVLGFIIELYSIILIKKGN